MKCNWFLVFFFLVLLFVISCESDSQIKRDMPDVSSIDLDLDLIRYDQEVFNLDTNNIGPSLKKLYDAYPEFSDLYFTRLTRFFSEDQDTFNTVVNAFLKDKKMRELQEQIESRFGNLEKIEKDLVQSCKIFKYYFPDYEIPAFYTLNSEFGFQSFIFRENQRDGIGIGLDLFLGEDLDYKTIDPREPTFSDYLTRTYNKDHVVRKTMAVLVQDMLGDPPGKRFIDQMIYNGKKLFLLEKLIPTAHDSIITEFTGEQVEWLNSNQMEIWSYFLEKNIMYETNSFEITKYLNPAPHSPGMPSNAPGNSASFMGLQIVKTFMRKNPETSLQELINYKDSQKFLESAKFKPKRR